VPLAAPPKNFASLKLPKRDVRVDRLRRISGHNSGEPHFGRHGVYRFDDPNKTFGTCYCGLDLDTAVAESLLHDELPDEGMFRISESLLELKFLVNFAAAAPDGVLTLADLTGANLKRLGGDNTISSECPYDTTQLWSAAVHAHPSGVDGIIYVSRQLNNKRAVAIYDRAAPKFGPATYVGLTSVPGFRRAKGRLGIRAVYP
jgi:hypothetical protein